MRRLPALLLVLLAAAPAAQAAPPEVRVSGNRFIDGAGAPLRLVGTTFAVGLNDSCRSPTFYSPDRRRRFTYERADDASLAALRSWGAVNTVRLTINAHCWLGIEPVVRSNERLRIPRGKERERVNARDRKAYRERVLDLVRRAHASDLVVILNLHVSAPKGTVAWAQWPLPDRDHSARYWRAMARRFRNDRSIVFEVFNEPYGRGVTWACLRDGCRLPNGAISGPEPVLTRGCGRRCPDSENPRGSYRTAGMQELVAAIRSTGARQPLLVPGLYFSNDMSRWLEFMPDDPLGQIAAKWHFYANSLEPTAAGYCASRECWGPMLAPIAARVPLISTEFGQYDCKGDQMADFMRWADEHGASFLAYGWYRADESSAEAQCGKLPPDGYSTPLYYGDGFTPTPLGQAFKNHLAGARPQ